MKILALLLTFSLNAWAAGGMVGNGGDAVLQEFNLRGIQMAAYFRAEPAVASRFAIDAAKFLDVVRKTKLEAQDHLTLNGVEVDAINHPDQMRIEVSRLRWEASSQLENTYFVQRRIALHEYLWVYGIDDTGYAISNAIIAELESVSQQIMDPSIREILHTKLCNDADSNDYLATKNLLSWGLDPNERCYRDESGLVYPAQTPWDKVLKQVYDLNSSNETLYIDLIRAMLKFGADPNASVRRGNSLYDSFWTPAVVATLGGDRFSDKVTDLLFEAGADPNKIDVEGVSTFATAAGQQSRRFYKMDLKTFNKFLSLGGDVNLSQATSQNMSAVRGIIQKEENADVVEALIKTGKTDWCTPSALGADSKPGPGRVVPTRAIDIVRPEYQSLLKQYGVTCGRFLVTYGAAMTCKAAQAQAREQCSAQGFKQMSQIPPDMSGNQCGGGGSINGVRDDYLAGYICTDD